MSIDDRLREQEPEMEAFLRRLQPGVEHAWQGASDEEIEQIETFAGQALPPFYRWLLARVGREAGSLPRPYHALRAVHVLDAYQSGEFYTDPPELFLARFDDPQMPLEMFYDLSQTCRRDALVETRETNGEVTGITETLREWLAWITLNTLRIATLRQRCRGTFVARTGDDLSSHLLPCLEALGFTRSVPGGNWCGVFETDDVALSFKINATDDNRHLLAYRLGGPDAGRLRRILGQIASTTGIKVTADSWDPRSTL